MSALKNKRSEDGRFSARKAPPKGADLAPKPGGELDYEALAQDVTRKYPRILARLAE